MVYASPHDTTVAVMRAGITKSELPWYQMVIRGFFAGGFIALGALFASVVAAGMIQTHETNPSLQKLMYALVFPAGLFLVAQTGMELFTSNVMFLTPGLLGRKISIFLFVKNLVTAWIMNFVGSIFVAGIFAYFTGITTTDPTRSYINAVGIRSFIYS